MTDTLAPESTGAQAQPLDSTRAANTTDSEDTAVSQERSAAAADVPAVDAQTVEPQEGDRDAAPGASATKAGLGSAHLLLLGAVAVLLATLTLTRLQLFAVYENERDAVDLVERLGRGLDLHTLGDGATLGAAVAAAGTTVGNSADAVWLDEGRLLRRRGYLFDLGRDAEGRLCVRAWPWRAGATGAAAYAWVPGAGLLGHTNGVVHAETPAPLWTGPSAPPALDATWMELDDSRSLALASRMP